MNKFKDIMSVIGKNKKAAFILVSCIALLVFGVVYKLAPETKADKEPVKNDIQSEEVSSDVDVSQEETIAVGVEVVSNVDEYFAGLRVENADMQSKDKATCEQIRTSIITRGYEDAYVCVSKDNTLEITVLCLSLTEDEVSVIANTAADVFDADLHSIVVKGIYGK